MTYLAPFVPLALALTPATLAGDLFTSFEFDDLSGDFTLGTDPLTVRFEHGLAQSTGNFDQYHTGLSAWMVLPSDTGEITFRVPAESVDFFFRDESPGVLSVLTLFAVDGSVLGTFNGTSLSWTQVTSGSATQPVARVTLQNNFTGGGLHTAAIDDLTYCAVPSVGTNYCGPAVSNSSGLPGVIAARGHTTAAFNSLTLTAQQLPVSKLGYFLNSMTQGSVQPPGSQGNLCLGGAIGRYAKQVASSGTAGVLVLVLDLTDTPTPNGPVTVLAGETWNFQAWFRDKNPGTTSNFTNGVSVAFN